jgi:CheY-like chemotaxis protein
MKILLVEDNAVSARIIEATLQRENHEIFRAKDGREALSVLEQTHDIHLVISDIMMPEMSGLELLAEIKASCEWGDLPVIFCTSHADVQSVLNAYRLGCQHYLVKPVNPSDLLQKISKVMVEMEMNKKSLFKDRFEIMNQYGLGYKTYNAMLADFGALLREKHPLVKKQLDEGSLRPDQLNLEGLKESASVLGAEQLLSALDAVTVLPEQEVSEGKVQDLYRALLREMKVAAKALPYLESSG